VAALPLPAVGGTRGKTSVALAAVARGPCQQIPFTPKNTVRQPKKTYQIILSQLKLEASCTASKVSQTHLISLSTGASFLPPTEP
jgi:hypothetical protein